MSKHEWTSIKSKIVHIIVWWSIQTCACHDASLIDDVTLQTPWALLWEWWEISFTSCGCHVCHILWFTNETSWEVTYITQEQGHVIDDICDILRDVHLRNREFENQQVVYRVLFPSSTMTVNVFSYWSKCSLRRVRADLECSYNALLCCGFLLFCFVFIGYIFIVLTGMCLYYIKITFIPGSWPLHRTFLNFFF